MQTLSQLWTSREPSTGLDRNHGWRPALPTTPVTRTLVVVGLLAPVLFGIAIACIRFRNHGIAANWHSDQHPWEFETTNQRELDHLQAADFLSKVNFYEDGQGMILPVSVTKRRLTSQFGLQAVADESGLIPRQNGLYGIQEHEIGSANVLVLGCGACHIGKAAGRVIPGLGLKTIDLFGLAQSTFEQVSSATAADAMVRAHDADWLRAKAAGRKAYRRLAHRTEYDSGTAGVINQFFALEMAIEELGLPPFEKPLIAPVKVPSFWGYGAKRQVGVFSDGFLKGNPPGSAGIPLFIGNYRLSQFEKSMGVYEEAERQFEQLLPPRYPFEINCDLARQGRSIFVNECVHCHSDHQRDQDQLPIFTQPAFIALDAVGTDAARADVYDDYVRDRVTDSSFATYLQTTDLRGGYLAPNLWGIWSRFPYLHNGSVANIADLLTTPAERPRYINVRDIGEESRFDPTRLGATPTNVRQHHSSIAHRSRWIYDTERAGLSNQGHDFGTDRSSSDKAALIEYLKTL